MTERETTNVRGRFTVLGALVIVGGALAWMGPGQGASAQGTPVRHRMTKITDTIYRADAPGTPGINSTSWLFINESDVLVTDSEGSPASARSLLEGVKSVTDKPVKYLVDTHFHIDHAYGNAALPPTVQIIGSDFTHKMLLSPEARQGVTFKNFTDPMPGRIEGLRKQEAALRAPNADKKELQRVQNELAPLLVSLRKLEEEIGTREAEIIGEHPDWLTYDLPPDLLGIAWRGRYRGQRQPLVRHFQRQ